jgi:tyrosinase
MAHDKLVSSGNGPVAITPISLEGLDSNDLPQRRNVETWYAAAQAGGEELLQLTLFIEAMQEFQSGPKEDQLSYFRIAGIHSFPRNVSWNEDKAPDPVNPVEYCPHNRIVFPTWHRTYMMLFERRISDLMIDTAVRKTGDEKAKTLWKLAARKWRLPYYDWARSSSLPQLVANPEISVIKDIVDGVFQTVDVPNPMYSFRNGVAMGDASMGDYRIPRADDVPWDECKGTSRHAIKPDGPDRAWVAGISNNEEANAHLNGPYPTHPEEVDPMPSIKEAVQRLLTKNYVQDFERFATTKFDVKGVIRYLSLESIHNNLHNLIGGDDPATGIGHMAHVPVAAFDPVFWLHHCNVDRLTWLWQNVHDSWLHDGPADDKGDNATSHLMPFRPEARLDSWFVSNDMRYVRDLHYTYDDPVAVPEEEKGGGGGGGDDGDNRRYNPPGGGAPRLGAPRDGGDDHAPRRSRRLAKHINNLYGVSDADGNALEAPAAGVRSMMAGVRSMAPAAGVRSTAPEGGPRDTAPEGGLRGTAPGTGVRGTADAATIPRPSTYAALTQSSGQLDPVINVIYNRYALEGTPYAIHFFIGPVNDSAPYSVQPSLVGSVHTFTAPYQTTVATASSAPTYGCVNCMRQAAAGTLSAAEVPIQRSIDFEGLGITGGGGGSDRVALERHLVDNLRWVAVRNDGSPVPDDKLTDLKIDLRIGTCMRPTDQEEWAKYRVDNAGTEWKMESSKLGGSPVA